MEFVKGLQFGSAASDWQEGINTERLRNARADRMREILRKAGVAAILAAGEPNIRYLTGARGPEYAPQMWYVLFPADGAPILFQHAGYVTQVREHTPWITEVRTARSWLRGIPGPEASQAEAGLFAAEIHEELKRLELSGEKLAVAGIDALGQAALRDVGVEVTNGHELILEATKIKLPDEVACVQMALAINDRMWTEIAKRIEPGMSEWELANLARQAGFEGGAENVRVGFRSGPLSLERGTRGAGQPINFGDVVYGNTCGTQYLGYRVCIYRTMYVGAKVPSDVQSTYARLLERLRKVMSELRPGATTADAARHFPPATTWGFDDEVEVLTMEIGHGTGIGGYELPVVNRQWSLEHPQVIEPGMVIAVEGRERVNDRSGVRLENMVYVTDDGPVLLDSFPSDEVLPTWDY